MTNQSCNCRMNEQTRKGPPNQTKTFQTRHKSVNRRLFMLATTPTEAMRPRPSIGEDTFTGVRSILTFSMETNVGSLDDVSLLFIVPFCVLQCS